MDQDAGDRVPSREDGLSEQVEKSLLPPLHKLVGPQLEGRLGDFFGLKFIHPAAEVDSDIAESLHLI